MEKSKLKSEAKRFLHTYGIRNVNYASLCRAAEEQGYTVIEFDPMCDDGDVALLIESLKLSKILAQSKGLTYADDTYRIIFVHESLTEKEKQIVLAHENGHIFLSHIASSPVIGKDVQDEFEANEFAHYLLNKTSFFKRFKWPLIACGIGLVTVAAVLTLVFCLRESKYYGHYYLTDTGNKYHMADCKYIKNRTNTHRMTKEEFESGDYEPCKICVDEEPEE